MDGSRFAALVGSLARLASRRRALGALGVGLAATLGRPGPPVAAAPRKHHHHRCIRNTPPFTTPKHHCHADKQCCNSGHCCLFSGENKHGCVNLSNNQSFCGTTCQDAMNCIDFNPVRQCVDGVCVPM